MYVCLPKKKIIIELSSLDLFWKKTILSPLFLAISFLIYSKMPRQVFKIIVEQNFKFYVFSVFIRNIYLELRI